MTEKFPVTIVGGGLVGMATAIGAARLGLDVAVIERQPADVLTEPSFDGRASALAYGTKQMLEQLGIWRHMAAQAEAIREIRISDGEAGKTSLLHLHFDHRDLGQGVLGYMVENRHTRIALYKTMGEMDNIHVFAPDSADQIDRSKDQAHITLKSGKKIETSLLIGADGRASGVRKSANIGVTEWGYDQVGIVAAIAHEKPHYGIAHEKFLPSGPFAILPLTDNRASLVWTEKAHLSDTIMNLSDRAFEAEVRRRIGGFLGDVHVIGGRWSYPLTLAFAEGYTDTRLALVGDAVHGIHPIAGQGLNLGLRDVAALLDVMADRTYSGFDIGDSAALEAYSQWRHFDTMTLMTVTDSLNRLFSNNHSPIAMARRLGLAGVDKIKPLRKFFMAHARGDLGHRPRLLEGLPLKPLTQR